MLKKKSLKIMNRTSVVFEIEGFEDAEQVSLVGEFNDWDGSRNRMKRRKDGAWAITLRLPNDSRFEYRYLVDGEHWTTDENADEVVPNEFGGYNSVVLLR